MASHKLKMKILPVKIESKHSRTVYNYIESKVAKGQCQAGRNSLKQRSATPATHNCIPFFLRLHTCPWSPGCSSCKYLKLFVTLLRRCQRCQCLAPHLPKPRRSERVGAVGFFSFQAVQDESTMLHPWKPKKTLNQSGFLDGVTHKNNSSKCNKDQRRFV